jgi:hypothetical protein
MKQNPFETHAVSGYQSSDIFSARFAQEHATNKGIAYFIYAQMPLGVIALVLIKYQYLYWYELLYTTMVSIVVGMIAYGKSLSAFTDEARDIIWRREMETGVDLDGDGLVGKPEASPLDRPKTIMRGADKNHHWFIEGMNLSESQIKKICETAANTKTLTINYLEKIGLSRQEAEMFRVTLVNNNFATFDANQRIVFTDRGYQMFANNK